MEETITKMFEEVCSKLSIYDKGNFSVISKEFNKRFIVDWKDIYIIIGTKTYNINIIYGWYNELQRIELKDLVRNKIINKINDSVYYVSNTDKLNNLNEMLKKMKDDRFKEKPLYQIQFINDYINDRVDKLNKDPYKDIIIKRFINKSDYNGKLIKQNL